MDMKRLDITPFETVETRKRTYAMHVDLHHKTARKRKRKTVGTSMLAKIGACAAVLVLVLVMEVYLSPQEPAVMETSAGVTNTDESNSEENLGRLQFVDGGGLVGVFAGRSTWHLPVSASEVNLSEEAQLLELRAEAGSEVSLSAGGEVRAIGEDTVLGDYVRIHHGNDLESIYYHLTDICVEKGQPLLLGDTLGKVGSDGLLYLRIYQTGAPQPIEDFISVSKQS